MLLSSDTGISEYCPATMATFLLIIDWIRGITQHEVHLNDINSMIVLILDNAAFQDEEYNYVLHDSSPSFCSFAWSVELFYNKHALLQTWY